jgi:hypothetical protein
MPIEFVPKQIRSGINIFCAFQQALFMHVFEYPAIEFEVSAIVNIEKIVKPACFNKKSPQ